MAGFRIQRPDLSGVRTAVRENLRTSNALILCKGTRIIRCCLLVGILSALMGSPLGSVGAMIGVCYGLYGMKPAARGFGRAAWLGALVTVLTGSMLWPNNGVLPVFPAALAALMLWACYSLFRSPDVQRRTGKVVVVVVAGTVLSAAMQGENDTVSLLGRGLGIAVLLVAMMKVKCIAYAGVLDGFDEALAKKWRQQWKLLRITAYSALGVFIGSMLLGLQVLWLLNLAAGGGMLVFLMIRQWLLLGRSVRVCRSHIRLKLVVDSVPC